MHATEQAGHMIYNFSRECRQLVILKAALSELHALTTDKLPQPWNKLREVAALQKIQLPRS